MAKNMVLVMLMASVLALTSCTMLSEMQAVKQARYEPGEHKGAKYCGECHQEIFGQWAKNSRHALANNSDSFHAMENKFKSDFMLNAVMGVAMCYACHGNNATSQGVDCETCHGTVMPNRSIEETHKRKFQPAREELRKPGFCAKCHEMNNPMSGSPIMSVYSEWQRSEAAANGRTCQNCHMEPRGNGVRYHGFDSAVRNVGIYRDKLDVKDLKLGFPQLSLAIENRVTGHAIPASCGTKLLVLEIKLVDLKGEELHRIIQTFTKKNDLMASLMPYKTIENTQLQSGETRHLTFSLPARLHGKIGRVTTTLKFYEVPDEYLGDLQKANWISEPFFEKEFNIETVNQIGENQKGGQ